MEDLSITEIAVGIWLVLNVITAAIILIAIKSEDNVEED